MVVNRENQELNEKMATMKGRPLRNRRYKEDNCEQPSCGHDYDDEKADYGKLTQIGRAHV